MQNTRVFYIRDKEYKYAILHYNITEHTILALQLNSNKSVLPKMPLMFRVWAMSGNTLLSSNLALRVLSERVEPSGRKNIESMLSRIAENHNTFYMPYNEIELLIAHQGRCCQDDAYLEEVPPNEIPSFD